MSLTRRTLLQVGFSSAAGLTLPQLCDGEIAVPALVDRKGITAKSVLLVYLPGAPSQIDTFDMKPNAPADIRGSFDPISTAVPGTHICEHMPLLAQRTDKFAIVRSMELTTNAGAHEHATPLMLGGIDERPPGTTLVNTRNDWPCFAAGLQRVSSPANDLPIGVHLPHFITNGAMGYAGQNGGFLGAAYDPMQVESDPNDPSFPEGALRLAEGLSVSRLSLRRNLLSEFNQHRRQLDRAANKDGYSAQRERAFRLLTSGKLAQAFDLNQESDRYRDKYGRHTWGQSLLLARRLIQAGIPIVQANLGAAGCWDTHKNNFTGLKNRLLPPFDAAMSALLDDLHATGLIEETLVIVISEFGRTPKIGGFVKTILSDPTGREHWGSCFHSLFAGGGVKPGCIIGESDKHAAWCKTQSFHPSDVGATIYTALGVDPHTEICDQVNRPYKLNSGTVMRSLFG
jgi:hypothetical protein